MIVNNRGLKEKSILKGPDIISEIKSKWLWLTHIRRHNARMIKNPEILQWKPAQVTKALQKLNCVKQ